MIVAGIYEDSGAWQGDYGGGGAALRMPGFHDADGGGAAAARRLMHGVGMVIGGGRGPDDSGYGDGLGLGLGAAGERVEAARHPGP